MTTKSRLSLLASLAILATLVLSPAQAQTNAPDKKTKASDSKVLDVDTVVAHPDKFKGKIDVAGRVAKVDADKKLLVLGCEDACVAMPVKFSGTMPKTNSNVVVRGQITKDAEGRYLFDAESVTPKK